MTGWDLVATAQKRVGDFWTITQSQVYRELAAMAATGLVAVGPTGPRDRKPHSITAWGAPRSRSGWSSSPRPTRSVSRCC